MTTQQQIDSLRAVVDRLTELADKISDALTADDTAEAEVAAGELKETLAAATEGLDRLTPGTNAEPPADAPPPAEQPGD